MSADNGVYIGRFADGEFRVIHAQAIDNLWYPDGENATYIYSYYKDGKVFWNRKEARDYAFTLADEIMDDDFCSILEYGVSELEFSHSFSQYAATADMKKIAEWDAPEEE